MRDPECEKRGQRSRADTLQFEFSLRRVRDVQLGLPRVLQAGRVVLLRLAVVRLCPETQRREVESFALVPVDEACRLVAETKEFKPNVALVLVDFFVRHGIVTPEERSSSSFVKALRQ